MDDIDQFEATLATRLHRAAERMPLDPDALAAVRGRSLGRRRRRRVSVAVTGVAAAALVAVGAVGVLGVDGGAGRVDVDAAGSGTTADAPANDTVSVLDPDAKGDATLVVATRPDADPSADPGVAVSEAWMFDGEQRWHASGTPTAELADLVEDGVAPVRAGLEALDAAADEPVGVALEQFVQAWTGTSMEGLDEYLAGPVTPERREGYVAGALMEVVWSGLATPEQVVLVQRVFDVLPTIVLTASDGGSVRVTESGYGAWLEYDPVTGRAIARGGANPEDDLVVETVSQVYRVEVLELADGGPVPIGLGTTPPSTTAPAPSTTMRADG